MTSTYSRACTEALAIIDCLADEEYNKIPIEKLRFWRIIAIQVICLKLIRMLS